MAFHRACYIPLITKPDVQFPFPQNSITDLYSKLVKSSPYSNILLIRNRWTLYHSTFTNKFDPKQYIGFNMLLRRDGGGW